MSRTALSRVGTTLTTLSAQVTHQRAELIRNQNEFVELRRVLAEETGRLAEGHHVQPVLGEVRESLQTLQTTVAALRSGVGEGEAHRSFTEGLIAHLGAVHDHTNAAGNATRQALQLATSLVSETSEFTRTVAEGLDPASAIVTHVEKFLSLTGFAIAERTDAFEGQFFSPPEAYLTIRTLLVQMDSDSIVGGKFFYTVASEAAVGGIANATASLARIGALTTEKQASFGFDDSSQFGAPFAAVRTATDQCVSVLLKLQDASREDLTTVQHVFTAVRGLLEHVSGTILSVHESFRGIIFGREAVTAVRREDSVLFTLDEGERPARDSGAVLPVAAPAADDMILITPDPSTRIATIQAKGGSVTAGDVDALIEFVANPLHRDLAIAAIAHVQGDGYNLTAAQVERLTSLTGAS